jgi:hypothetical protein
LIPPGKWAELPAGGWSGPLSCFTRFAKEFDMAATPGFRKATQSLSKWMQRKEWEEDFRLVFEEHITQVCDEFNVEPQYLEDEIGLEYAEMAVAWAVEDFFTSEFEPDARNLVKDYLKRRGWKESAPVKTCLQALRQSVASLYEVIETVPKSHLFVRDLVRGGEPIRLEDRELAVSVVKWDRLAMRLMEIRGKHHATSTILDFGIEESDGLLNTLRQAIKTGREEAAKAVRDHHIDPVEAGRVVEDFMLRGASPRFTQFWLRGIFRTLRRPPPRIVNYEDHNLLFGEARFPIVADGPKAVERGLDEIGELERLGESETLWQWTGGPSAAPLGGSSETMSSGSFSETGEPVRGMLEIIEGELVLTANSRERTEHGIALLEEKLPGLLGRPLIEYIDIQDALANAKDSRGPAKGSSLSPAERSAIMHEFLDRHYREVMALPIPALGDLSPLEASQSEDGRVALLCWLKQLENAEARRALESGSETYDTAWLWELLDMTDPNV